MRIPSLSLAAMLLFAACATTTTPVPAPTAGPEETAMQTESIMPQTATAAPAAPTADEAAHSSMKPRPSSRR